MSSDTEAEDDLDDLLKPVSSAHSREEDDEEQHTSKGESSESSGHALEHGSKATHDVNVQRPTPPPTEEPAESTSGKPSSSKTAPMAPPPQRTPSTSTLVRPKLNDLGQIGRAHV